MLCAHVFCVETRNGENTLGTWFSDVDERGGFRRETSDIFQLIITHCIVRELSSDRLILTEIYQHQKNQLCLNQSGRTLFRQSISNGVRIGIGFNWNLRTLLKFKSVW